MKQPLLRFWLFNSSILFYLLSSHPTTAQIVPDATLPVNSNVTQQGNTSIIEGGTTAGSNLFHSFKDFSLPNGAEAFFNNALEIQNIFSRVTGGNISNIDGLIRANGVANLFLINPNGIIFGQNARLNIGGSFFASTASSIRFADGMEFSATNPNAPPLLTINVPIGLQYGKNAGEIRVKGNGQEFGLDGATESFESSLNPLEVLPGKTLAIAGGNIIIDGGILQAPGGRVELGAVAGEGTIGINADGSLSFPDGVARADVSIINKAGINVLAAGGGSIAIAARNIDISGNSLLTGGIATGKGTSDSMAGDISLGATEAITIDSSRIENNVNPDAIGNSGSINIKGGSLSLTNNARLDASTFGQGKAGSITIIARDTVSFNGGGAYSIVASKAKGDGGNINITTGSLSVKNGARLSATIAGEGKGGNVNIIASDRVSFDGVNGLPTAALTNVETTGIGNAGDVNIKAASLEVTNGALLESRTRGTGKGGNVTINTSNTVLFDGQGNQSSFGPSGAYTSVESNANGDAGDINITTGSLSVKNGARLNATIAGEGKGGNVNIIASDRVSFDGVNGLPTAALTNVETTGIGNAGDVNIKAASLEVTNGALLESRTRGTGKGGNVTINTSNTVLFDGQGNQSSFGPSGAYTSVESTANGNGGDINITTGSLSVKNGARLSASASGQEASGNGGNITINATTFSLDDGANLTATNEGSGLAGNIVIKAGNQVSVRNSSITSTSNNDDENSGFNDIKITAPEGSIFLNQATIITTNSGAGLAGDIVLNASKQIAIADSKISSDGNFGRIFIGSQPETERGESFFPALVTIEGINTKLTTDNSPAPNTDAGSINIKAGQLIINDATLSSSTKGAGEAGDISVNVNGSVSFTNNAFFTNVEAGATGKGGDITIKAGSLSLTNGAQLQTSVIGSTDENTEGGRGNAGNVTIDVRDGVTISGSNQNNESSAIFSDVEAGASGNGGNITINARTFSLDDGAELNAENEGSGLAGNIEINAGNQVSVRNSSITSTSNNNDRTDYNGINITASEGSIFLNQATISTTNFGSGFAGDIVLSARNNVSISNQSTIASDGYLGRILVGRNEVYQETLSPGSVTIDNSKLSTTNAKSDGDVAIDAGEISIEATGSISLANRSEINAATARLGDAGSVTLRVENGEISLDNSYIFSTVEAEGIGNGGNISITARSLSLTNGAQLQTLIRSTEEDPTGKRFAGNISIKVSEDVFFAGFADSTDPNGNPEINPSGVFSTVEEGGVGNGGNININARSLSLTNGAEVSVTSAGSQGAGSIDINARYVRLNNGTLSAETKAGDRGNISVRSSALILRRESRINTNATGSATGGNINIETDVLAALENSDITANAEQAAGGRVTIKAQAVFGAQPLTREELQARLGNDLNLLDPGLLQSSDITAISQQGGPQLQGTVQINTPDVDPSSGLIQLPDNVVDITGLVDQQCSRQARRSSFVVTGRGGIPESPDDPLTPDGFLVDLVTIDPKAQASMGEIRSNNVNSDTDKSDAPVAEIVEATGWYTNEKGEVVLTASTPTRYPVWRTQPLCK